MLGLVTVVLGLGFQGLRVLSRLGFSRFSCGMVGIFSVYRSFSVRVYYRVSSGFVGLRFAYGLEYLCA